MQREDSLRFSVMALINCPECELEISSNAKTCPHCGSPSNIESKYEIAMAVWTIVVVAAGVAWYLSVL